MSYQGRILFNVNVAWFFLSHRSPIASAALRRGFEVHLATHVSTESEAKEIRGLGVHLHRVSLSRGGTNPLRDLQYALQLTRLVRRVRPTIVHNVTAKPVIYGTMAARIAGAPGIVNAVSGLGYAFASPERNRWLSGIVRVGYRLALRARNSRVIVQNDDDRTALELTTNCATSTRVVTIAGSGVDLQAFVPRPEPNGYLSVVLPARMLVDKGIIEFSQAAQKVRQAFPHAQFVLAGGLDLDNPAALQESQLKALMSEGNVQWLGHVDDMASLLASSHIVCLPSYREGLPKALIEACASGRAIVATDVPGCRDVVRDGLNGILVRPRDAESLAIAIERLIREPQLRAEMGKRGRERAENEFDVQLVIEKTMAVYESLL